MAWADLIIGRAEALIGALNAKVSSRYPEDGALRAQRRYLLPGSNPAEGFDSPL